MRRQKQQVAQPTNDRTDSAPGREAETPSAGKAGAEPGLLHIQKALGNQAAQREVEAPGARPSILGIGDHGDHDEQGPATAPAPTRAPATRGENSPPGPETDPIATPDRPGPKRPGPSAEPTPARGDNAPQNLHQEPEGSERERPLAESPASRLLAEETENGLAPGQMTKDTFLDDLEASVRNTAEDALRGTAWSAEGCPYIEHWLRYYRTRNSRQIERAIHRYAPEATGITSAAEYIPLITERIRRSIAVWSTTGEITGVPEGVPLPDPSASPADYARSLPAAEGVFFKAREGGAKQPRNPAALQNHLGPGSSLGSSLRSRMEAAFGADFSAVRIHTDARAESLSDRLNARAFTIGRHVAFGTGEYKPGTLVGDALIAHELAHVVQQEQASAAPAAATAGPQEAGDRTLEADADRSAASVVSTLWGGTRGALAGAAGRVRSGVTSGLRVQRCSTSSSATVDRITIVDSPTGAIGGYPPITSGDLNHPGPFNNPATGAVNNVHQIHFHLDSGDSAGLTPTRSVTATATAAGANISNVTNQADGPGAHEVKRPGSDKIVVADAPGVVSLSASNYPFVLTADFTLTVAAGGTDVARIKYGVRIKKNSSTDIPNTENRIFPTEKKDLARNRDLP